MEVHIDDVCDIILRIFKDNGHIEEAANIREWFCGEADVGFWSFFRTMVENYGSLLQVREREREREGVGVCGDT